MAKSSELGSNLLNKYGNAKSTKSKSARSSSKSQELGQKLYEKYSGPDQSRGRRENVSNWVEQYNQVMGDISNYASVE
jgi:hypothetical protein